MTGLDAGARCPCLSGETYGECCRLEHTGARRAATAERLMRTRYSAFAVGRADYLLETWHASTRPASLELEEGTRWVRLDVIRTEAGGPFDERGVVEFVASYREDGARGRLHETSRFVREGAPGARRWYYLDGVLAG